MRIAARDEAQPRVARQLVQHEGMLKLLGCDSPHSWVHFATASYLRVDGLPSLAVWVERPLDFASGMNSLARRAEGALLPVATAPLK